MSAVRAERRFAAAPVTLVLLRVFAAAIAIAASTTDVRAAPPAQPSFASCAACHSVEDGRHATGPSLYRIVGRKAGGQAGFRYSNALLRSGIVWDDESLARFLRDPQAAVPGNRMAFSGVDDESHIAEIIRYLRESGR